MTDDINIKAWEQTANDYAIKSTKIFQQKQLDLIKAVARREGITAITAEIKDNGQVMLDFDIDGVETWHCDFFRCIEAIVGTMNDKELNKIKKELKNGINGNKTQ